MDERGENWAEERRPLPTRGTIEARRTKVAALYSAGYSVRQIAAALGASVGTIHSDVQVILQRFKEEQAKSVERVRLAALHRLATLHRMAHAIAASPNAKPEVRLKAVAEVRATVMSMVRVCGAMPSEKLEVTGRDGGPLALVHGIVSLLPTTFMDQIVEAHNGVEVEQVLRKAAAEVPRLGPLVAEMYDRDGDGRR